MAPGKSKRSYRAAYKGEALFDAPFNLNGGSETAALWRKRASTFHAASSGWKSVDFTTRIAPMMPMVDRRSFLYGAGFFLALALFVALAFGKAAQYPFVNYDDQEYVFGHPEIFNGLTFSGLKWAFTHSHAGNWHPLTSISHMLDCQFFGLRAGAHHVVNLVLHFFAAFALFRALLRMTADFWKSAFVSLAFAIHPLRAESVVWIAERKDVLSGLLFALTLLAYSHYARRSTTANYLVTLLLFALGLMAKPMLVTVPLVLLLLDYWPLRRAKEGRWMDWKQLLLEKVPFMLLSLTSAIATLLAQQQSLAATGELPLAARTANALVSYVIYLRQTFWPGGLALFYPHNENAAHIGVVLRSGAILVAITLAAWVTRAGRPYLLAGWLWFLIMLVPVIGIVQVGQQAHADRYTYLPQIGIILALTWLVSDLVANQRHRVAIMTALALLLAGSLTATTQTQVSYWGDSETLWRHALAVTTRNDTAHANLADLLMQREQIEEARQHCEDALRIRPRNPDALNNLGMALWYEKQPSAAVMHYEQALQVRTHHLNAETNLAWILSTYTDSSFRDGGRAVRLMQDVLNRAGRLNPILLRTLAAAHAETGDFAAAIATAENALQLAQRQGNVALTEDLRRSLERFHQNLPLRDSGPAATIPELLVRPN